MAGVPRMCANPTIISIIVVAFLFHILSILLQVPLNVLLTLAPYTNIFAVYTVMCTNSSGRTINQSGLSTHTSNIIQVDQACSIGESSKKSNSSYNYLSLKKERVT